MIGIISDTHGSLSAFDRAMELLSGAESIIHLGDVLAHGPRNDLPMGYNPRNMAVVLSKMDNFTYIKGNCDAEVDEMVIGQDISLHEKLIQVDGLKIYATHGHRMKYEEMIARAVELGADICLYGHTHIKELRNEGDLIVCNPGSTSIPKDGAASIAVIENGWIKLLDLQTGKMISAIEVSG